MQHVLKPLIQQNSSKIVLVVLDGLGGLPANGKTELEAAMTPNLDTLARESASGSTSQSLPGSPPAAGLAT